MKTIVENLGNILPELLGAGMAFGGLWGFIRVMQYLGDIVVAVYA